MGNIFGRWEGSRQGAGAVLTGSHCDAIPLAGGRAGVGWDEQGPLAVGGVGPYHAA